MLGLFGLGGLGATLLGSLPTNEQLRAELARQQGIPNYAFSSQEAMHQQREHEQVAREQYEQHQRQAAANYHDGVTIDGECEVVDDILIEHKEELNG